MKMEGIELYPHNQKAYDNLCAMLRDNNRACVVQPTGTGKFVIIAKMAQDNPGKNFLLLGTNDYMYIDQMANLSDIAPGFTPKNLQFMTYATAMAKARCGDEIPRCDVIVADEFHHCGAPEWGKGVQYVVENNPDAKIVGFSATPQRPFVIRTKGATWRMRCLLEILQAAWSLRKHGLTAYSPCRSTS